MVTPDWEVLQGGVANAGAVVRVGPHVLRPSNEHSASILEFLSELEASGFQGAPVPVRLETDGRERLRFIPGDVAIPPYPDWAQTDDSLRSIVELIRGLHDASVGVATDHMRWSSEMADPEGGPVICHNDVCLENVVFRDGHAVALIDFDFAAPGRRPSTWPPSLACVSRLTTMSTPPSWDGVRPIVLVACVSCAMPMDSTPKADPKCFTAWTRRSPGAASSFGDGPRQESPGSLRCGLTSVEWSGSTGADDGGQAPGRRSMRHFTRRRSGVTTAGWRTQERRRSRAGRLHDLALVQADDCHRALTGSAPRRASYLRIALMHESSRLVERSQRRVRGHAVETQAGPATLTHPVGPPVQQVVPDTSRVVRPGKPCT